MVAWLAQMQAHRIEREQPPPSERWNLPTVASPAINGMTARTILILASMILSTQMEQRHDHLC
jgi:hypothetical protein